MSYIKTTFKSIRFPEMEEVYMMALLLMFPNAEDTFSLPPSPYWSVMLDSPR